jgi:hypothetical protein
MVQTLAISENLTLKYLLSPSLGCRSISISLILAIWAKCWAFCNTWGN